MEQDRLRYSQVAMGEPVDDFAPTKIPASSSDYQQRIGNPGYVEDNKRKCRICIAAIITVIAVTIMITTIVILHNKHTTDYSNTCILREKGVPPSGTKLMSSVDVKATSDQCKNVMGPNEIVALSDAKYDGENYGYKFSYGNYLGCGYVGRMLIMDGTQTETLDFDAPCP